MSKEAGASGTPLPPAPVARFADIVFVDGVLDPGGQNPKTRRVVVLTPDDALAAGFPIVAAPVTSRVPPVPGPDHVVLAFCNPRAPGIPPPASPGGPGKSPPGWWSSARRRSWGIRATCRGGR
jgi:hypothetical protein